MENNEEVRHRLMTNVYSKTGNSYARLLVKTFTIRMVMLTILGLLHTLVGVGLYSVMLYRSFGRK